MSTALEPILTDSRASPAAFVWYGALDEGMLRRWVNERSLAVPADLFALWATLGAGEMFESEELLAPFGAPQHAADFDDANEQHRKAGLPTGTFVFHDGSWLSAVRQVDARYVTLDRSTYVVLDEFASLREWYVGTVRREFAMRYGLGK